MKKALFIIVALASVAIGCTKSEVVKAPGRGREIKFDTYVGKTPVTKAESADLTYLQRPLPTDGGQGGFQVYAFLHTAIVPTTTETDNGPITTYDVSNVGVSSAYMNKEVSWMGPQESTDADGNPITVAGYWDYDGVVYWPDYTTKRKLAFAAYALNAQGEMTFEDDDKTSTGKSFTKFTYTVPDAVADQKDLLVTPFLPNQGLAENAPAASVNLNFKHLLSRIAFQVVANQESGVEIDIQEVTLNGKFPTQGKVDLKGIGEIAPLTEETSTYVNSYDLFPNDDHFVTKSSILPANIFANRLVTKEEDVTNEDGSVTPGKVTTVESSDLSNRYMMIMPSTQATNIASIDEEGNVTYVEGADRPGAYIDVQYLLTDAAVANARVSLDGWKFEAGKSYTFIFKVSTSSIEFEVKVEDWTEHFTPVQDGGKPNEGNGYFTLTPIVGEN